MRCQSIALRLKNTEVPFRARDFGSLRTIAVLRPVPEDAAELMRAGILLSIVIELLPPKYPRRITA